MLRKELFSKSIEVIFFLKGRVWPHSNTKNINIDYPIFLLLECWYLQRDEHFCCHEQYYKEIISMWRSVYAIKGNWYLDEVWIYETNGIKDTNIEIERMLMLIWINKQYNDGYIL